MLGYYISWEQVNTSFECFIDYNVLTGVEYSHSSPVSIWFLFIHMSLKYYSRHWKQCIDVVTYYYKLKGTSATNANT